MTKSQIAKPFAMLVSLAVAGTCLATPALAATNGSAAETETEATATAQATEGTQYVVNGCGVTLPSDLQVMQLEDSLVAANEDNTFAVGISPLGEYETFQNATTDDEMMEFFSAMTTEVAKQSDGTLLDGSEWGDLSDGSGKAACFALSMQENGDDYIQYLFYIPTADKSCTVVQVVIPTANADEYADVAADIVSSMTLDVDASAAKASTVAVGDAVEVAGITISLPDDFAIDTDDGEGSVDWVNEDGTAYVGTIPDLFDGAIELTDDEFDEAADEIAEGLEGKIVASQLIETKTAKVHLYAMTYTDDGDTYLCAIALVPVSDGTITSVLAMCDANDADTLGDAFDAIFASIELA